MLFYWLLELSSQSTEKINKNYNLKKLFLLFACSIEKLCGYRYKKRFPCWTLFQVFLQDIFEILYARYTISKFATQWKKLLHFALPAQPVFLVFVIAVSC